MAFSGWSTPYYDRMDTDPDESSSNSKVPNERLELLYETEQEKALRIGKTTNQQDTLRSYDTNNEATLLHAQHKEYIINI